MSINISVINAGFTILLVCVFRQLYCVSQSEGEADSKAGKRRYGMVFS